MTATPQDDDRPMLLCFSHLRWGFVWQRPQHLLSRASAHYRVFFFEEPIFSEEPDAPFLQRIVSPEGITVLLPMLPAGQDRAQAAKALQLLVDEFLLVEGKIDLLWYYTPDALRYSRHVRARNCLYDCMDQLSAFLGAPTDLGLLEEEMFARADVVTCGGRSLFEDKRTRHRNVHLFPSSIEARHFRRARELRRRRTGSEKPVLGFFGVIDERLDLALVDAVARARPDWTLAMIGPVVKIDPSVLPRQENIKWKGRAEYADLPDALAEFDIGIMPFALNEATRFISPTKTPEFLAAGLPLVSTAIRDVVIPYGEAGLVEIAANAHDFIRCAQHLLDTPKDSWRAKVDDFLSTMSWDATWGGIHELVAQPARRVVGVAGA